MASVNHKKEYFRIAFSSCALVLYFVILCGSMIFILSQRHYSGLLIKPPAYRFHVKNCLENARGEIPDKNLFNFATHFI
jgi:hypothetical protein